MERNDRLRVGLLSDTHGLLRPSVRAFLAGSDYIIHGGDIGNAAILEDLAAMAPLIVVKGNNDKQPWASHLRETELVRIGGVFAYVIHDLAALDIEPSSIGVGVIICGHSHKAQVSRRGGVLFVNPGSCGPRRFKLPISVGELLVTGSQVRARTAELAEGET